MSSEDMVTLGMHMRRARENYNTKLRTLAEQLELDAAYLSRIENGREKPSQKVLVAYAKRFRIDLDELNRFAGRISEDVTDYLVSKPDALRRVRAEMAGTESR